MHNFASPMQFGVYDERKQVIETMCARLIDLVSMLARRNAESNEATHGAYSDEELAHLLGALIIGSEKTITDASHEMGIPMTKVIEGVERCMAQ